MELFTKLFGSLLALVYHCFDRIVTLAYLPLLTRPENVVHFFHDLQRIHPITKEALRKRTDEYHAWVEAYAKKNHIAMEWAEKGIRKKDDLLPELEKIKSKTGSESTSSSRAWRSDRASESRRPSFPPKIPITVC